MASGPEAGRIIVAVVLAGMVTFRESVSPSLIQEVAIWPPMLWYDVSAWVKRPPGWGSMRICLYAGPSLLMPPMFSTIH